VRRKKSYYMEKLAELFGKKLDETFVVTNPGAKSENEFAFTEKGFVWRTPGGDVINDLVLHMLLRGDAVIKKGPWKPNIGDEYYYIDLANPNLYSTSTWENNQLDNYRYQKRLLYKSQNRLMPMARKMKAKLDSCLEESDTQTKLDL